VGLQSDSRLRLKRLPLPKTYPFFSGPLSLFLLFCFLLSSDPPPPSRLLNPPPSCSASCYRATATPFRIVHSRLPGAGSVHNVDEQGCGGSHQRLLRNPRWSLVYFAATRPKSGGLPQRSWVRKSVGHTSCFVSPILPPTSFSRRVISASPGLFLISRRAPDVEFLSVLFPLQIPTPSSLACTASSGESQLANVSIFALRDSRHRQVSSIFR